MSEEEEGGGRRVELSLVGRSLDAGAAGPAREAWMAYGSDAEDAEDDGAGAGIDRRPVRREVSPISIFATSRATRSTVPSVGSDCLPPMV